MSRKKTIFLISSGTNSDGYIEFVNLGNIVSVDVHRTFLHLGGWDGYYYWFSFDTADNAKNALDILIDQIDQSKANKPKGIIKINELDGVKGTDGRLFSSYNSSRPISW